MVDTCTNWKCQEWRILTSRMSYIMVWTVMDGGHPLEEFKSGEYSPVGCLASRYGQ